MNFQRYRIILFPGKPHLERKYLPIYYRLYYQNSMTSLEWSI